MNQLLPRSNHPSEPTPTAESRPGAKKDSRQDAREDTALPRPPERSPADTAPGLRRSRSSAKQHALSASKWAAAILGVYALAELGSFAGLPATQILFAAVLGAVVALSGRNWLVMPKKTQVATQALIGVVMGGYMQLGQLKTIGPLIGPIVVITAITLVLSIVTGWAFFRLVPGVSLGTAVLGTLAGGSAAVISAAEDLGADCRVVAFMQYFRVILIVATTPFLVAWVFGAVPKSDSRRTDLNANFFEHYRCPHNDQYFCIVTGRGDWLAGMCIAIVLCIVGVKLGQLIKLPSPATLGPMILTAIVTSTGISHGYAPDGILKELLFILIGLDVGLKFTRKSLRQVWRLFPAILVATITLAVVTALIPALMANALHVPQTDMYLATTPGGINAVIATASTVESNMPLVASTQSLRLIMLVVVLPLLARHLAKGWPPPEPTAAAKA
ncbi:membrane protein AbrB duplication [Segniliparus rotundus DSM 44985]|uniref:Membrane protein AbrB duplication n=1 Tax=Segniliparus rotundus (strain ATCC BAA-972 / CDC 1076 / CIP 108378 / DSM 44985 / JCM 13578) TaxID=640132 RepID=D6ZDI8_SEGRD|nr:AbrB family transcriptional regulator [Segniliparus rotundus]ADG97252.1 membrane protein AbrB duplication [Segniliparus rotundus DSM 44985]